MPSYRAQFRGLVAGEQKATNLVCKPLAGDYVVEVFEADLRQRIYYKARIVGAGLFADIKPGPLEKVKTEVEARFRERLSDWVEAQSWASLWTGGA